MSSNSTSATPTPTPTPSTSAPQSSASVNAAASSTAVSSVNTPASSSAIANSSPTAVSSTDVASSSTPQTSIASSSQVDTTSSTPASTTPSSAPTTSTPDTTPTLTPTPTSSQAVSFSTQTIVVTPTSGNGQPSTITRVSTSTAAVAGTTGGSSTSSSSSSTSSTSLISQNGSGGTSSKGLSSGGTIAVAVVVPIVAVALIAAAIIFFWRKRKQRKDAEELRRKEVEEYGYNPNNDPTLPAVGGAGSDGPFEMREGSSGYRGWGTTAVASSGRKASTTLSGGNSANGAIGQAYSGETSPTQGPGSDARSGDALVGPDGRPLSETEGMGAMGPAASANRTGDINRGPSNASSSYSAANRSDGSGDGPIPGGSYGANYYSNEQYGQNPYDAYGSPPGRSEMSGQPVIRDVSARRNTRIENPSHFPQQSAGISQNF
ncbi:transmembrane alpha-helix-containing protein [Coleophoma cylindrospora]|uniref:Transmembrane alpha-helix-containing protein n=1 Tax=Coleophoma cylindrospora TaxID=1849047 RepID=A0A3D8S789_9HELO|nr:transmembrane alpha-helix-containing protein [Coleophoma cylindrospora]